MDETSLAIIQRALAGLSLRYEYVAQNIANAGTPDYQPIRVSFEDQLRSAAARGRGAIMAVEPDISVEPNAGAMRLDLELASATQTAMRYRALVDLLARQFALARAAAAAGR